MEEKEKKIKNIRKKLKQIDEIKLKKSQNIELNSDQQNKLNSELSLINELNSLSL